MVEKTPPNKHKPSPPPAAKTPRRSPAKKRKETVSPGRKPKQTKFDPGKLLYTSFGPYNVTGRIDNSGRYSVVYKAEDENGKTVALKIPKLRSGIETLDVDSTLITKFFEECKRFEELSALYPGGIVNMLEYGEKPIPWIAMEYLPGGTLRKRMNKLSYEESRRILKDLLKTLHHVHSAKFIHRDIKPENILFTAQGRPKIADWGLGKSLLTSGGTVTSDFKGTPFYSAPEQLPGKKRTDERTDIYQLAMMFHEMLTGKRVFDVPDDDWNALVHLITKVTPPTPSSLNPSLPGYIDAVILKCLEKKKEDRYQSVEELYKALKFKDSIN